MKKLLLIGILAFTAFSIIISGCKKDEDENEEETTPKVGMSAKIDGVSWTADQAGCIVANVTTGIAGTKEQGQNITVTVSQFEEGEYSLLFESQVNVGAIIDSNVTYTTNINEACSGQVIISEINMTDSTISGNFDFVAYSPIGKGFIEVTEGKFEKIPFTF